MYKKIILTFLIIVVSSTTALAWDDCPKGLVDDPYPGECSKYIDTDNDGICDHSQLAPEDRDVKIVDVVEEVEDTTEEIAEEVAEVADMAGGTETDSEETVSTETDSTEKNANIDKIFLAMSIVIINLIAILTYVNLKKRKNGK